MKIFVCIKQVPDTETKIKVGSDNQSIDTNGVKWVMNPYDEYAVEEAIKLRGALAGSKVVVLSVGPKARVAEVLRTALAMGADDGIIIDAATALDPLPTARALAAVIQQEGDGQVIFTGKLAIDDNASSVSQMLAEFIGIPHATVVSKFSFNPESIEVERDIEGGAKEILQMKGAAVVAANKGLNTPRYANLQGIMKAKKVVLKEVSLDSLSLTKENKIKTLSLELPPEKPPVKMITGEVSQQISSLVHALRDEAKVL